MKLLFEIAKEFKSLLSFCVITAFALVFWHIGAKDLSASFGGGALAVITANRARALRDDQSDKPPR